MLEAKLKVLEKEYYHSGSPEVYWKLLLLRAEYRQTNILQFGWNSHKGTYMETQTASEWKVTSLQSDRGETIMDPNEIN